MLANFRIGTLVAVLGITVLTGGALLLVRAVPQEEFVEYRMSERAGCADRDCRGH